MSYKIAIIGPEDIISGFRMLGVTAFHVRESDEMLKTYQEIKEKTLDQESDEKYAVVIVVEELLEHISDDEYARMTKDPLPALVALPGIEGSRGQGSQRLKMLTEKAIGSDIF
jgi:vacuolar-type H+-ATPase subunit F/Vma7